MNIKVNVIDFVISWVKNMIKGPLAFLQRKATLTALHCSSAFAHLELLIFNLQTAILLLETIIGQTYKSNKKKQLRTIHQNKRKA